MPGLPVGPAPATHLDCTRGRTNCTAPMRHNFAIVGLGELLWARFPDGPRFGGAPVNFACHAAALGADVHVATSVGNDALGREALQALASHGVKTDSVAICDEAPTGTVQVTVDTA